MINFVLIGLCIIAGMLFRWKKAIPHDAHKGINAWIIYIALPAVSFKYLPHIHWSKDLLVLGLSPIVVFIGGVLWATVYSGKNKLDASTKGGLQLISGLSNTSFVGFPLIMAYFGEAQLRSAIICDQVTFLLFSVFGIIISVIASRQQLSATGIAKRAIFFPPFIGCVMAIALSKITDLSPFQPLFNLLAATVAPMALFSIGLQLSFNGWKEELKHLASVLTYKLLIAPLLVLGMILIAGWKGEYAQISAFEASMPILLSTSILADEYKLNPKLINLIIGVSIIVSLLTTAVWWWIITTVIPA